VSTAGWPRWVHWLPAIACAAVIFILSSVPRLPSPPGGMTDKHAHALAFGTLALACIHGLLAGRWRNLTAPTLLVAIVMTVAYGASDELHQAFVPGRTADLEDLLADALGAVVAGGVAWAWAILLRRRSTARSVREAAGRTQAGRS
jgi:VanZ family protein